MMLETNAILLLLVVTLWAAGIIMVLVARNKPDPGEDAQRLMTWATIFVAAAEQLFNSNEDKLTYVIDRLYAQTATMSTVFSEEEIRALVEWAVATMQSTILYAPHVEVGEEPGGVNF